MNRLFTLFIRVFILLLLASPVFAISSASQQALLQNIEAWQKQLSDNNAKLSEAVILRMKITSAYQQLGHIDKALTFTEQNLALSVKNHLSNQLLISLYNQFSDVFSSVGQLLKAEHYAQRAIALLSSQTPAKLTVSTHLTRANIATLLGDIEIAQKHFQQGLSLSQKYAFTQLQLKLRVNQLFVLWQNDRQKAFQQSQQLLAQSKHNHHALITIATLLLSQKEHKYQQLARDYLLASLDLATQQKNKAAMSISHGYLARLYEHHERNQDALVLLDKAIIEAQGQAIDEYLYQWYALKAKIEKQQGQLDSALVTVKKSIEILSPIRNQLDRGVKSPIASFEQAVKSVYYLHADLLLQKAAKVSGQRQQSLLKQARESIEALKVAELENYFQDDCVANLQARKKDIQQVSQKVAVVYPIILPDRIEILLSQQGNIKQFKVNVSSDKVVEQIKLLRSGLQTRPNNRYLYPAAQLYDWLIRPLWKTLKNSETMVVIADGALRTVPFSTLYDGKHYLIEKIALAAAPGFDLIEPQAIDWQQSEILLAGLSDAVQDFSPLPSVPRELSQIQSIVGGEKILNKSYTLDAIKQRLENKAYSVIHLATHAQFTGLNEQNYLLTHDNKMTMDKLKSMIGLGKFREKPIELLTMSACQTALGDDKAALGLAGVAIKAGARSALATLWFVDDEATSKAITSFYKQMKENNMSKAKALQKVQLELLSQPRFQHPAYWAPFLLIGNWL